MRAEVVRNFFYILMLRKVQNIALETALLCLKLVGDVATIKVWKGGGLLPRLLHKRMTFICNVLDAKKSDLLGAS